MPDDQTLHVRLARLVHEADVGRIPLSMGDRGLIEEAAALIGFIDRTWTKRPAGQPS